MAWDWPIITGVKKRIWPDKTPDEKPLPLPPSPPAPLPEFPANITPSNFNFVNYLRALMLLRAIPFAKLREEILKLPLKKIAYVFGVFIWIYMTYTFILHLLCVLTGVV